VVAVSWALLGVLALAGALAIWYMVIQYQGEAERIETDAQWKVSFHERIWEPEGRHGTRDQA
jgi:hypothetical protein